MKRSTKKYSDKMEMRAGKIAVKLTNLNKIYFPADGLSKGDLIMYYKEVAPFILPYLRDRAESMHRFPDGIAREGFFQKDVDPSTIPEWVKTSEVYSESNKKTIDYVVCNSLPVLLYMVNLGCIEINPWNSRTRNVHKPDWMVIDLDPEAIDFKEVIRAAREVKKVLDELGCPAYCKTSGATGLHIYIPLGARYDYEAVKNFAQLVAQLTHERLPKTTSILRMPARRQGKVYLDFLQNRRGQTLAAPYSVRPRPGAPVSTPLEWNEVNARLDPSKFNMHTVLRRLDSKGDLWKPVLSRGANILRAIKKLEG